MEIAPDDESGCDPFANAVPIEYWSVRSVHTDERHGWSTRLADTDGR